MKKIYKYLLANISYFFTAVAVLFLTGCESIPPGNPPEGPIVSITTTTDHPLTPDEAINNMTTALATCPELYTNQNIPTIHLCPIKGSEAEKEYELQLNYLTACLYRNLIGMNIIKLPTFSDKSRPDFLLASKYSKIFEFPTFYIVHEKFYNDFTTLFQSYILELKNQIR